MSYQSAKRELDRVFSLYIRKRDPKCVCCGRPTEVCGHFIPRGKLATRWDDDNCFGFCSDCNGLEQQTRTDPRWREIHVSIIGEALRGELESFARCVCKYSEAELREKIVYFKKAIKSLDKRIIE